MKGFTLLELTIAMAAMSILILGAVNLTSYVSMMNARATTRLELFHHATISMEFLTRHISEAQAIYLNTDNNNTLNRIDLFINLHTDQPHQRILNFRPVTYPHNRLMFGGHTYAMGTQEVARYISNVEIIHNTYTRLFYITITTETSISSSGAEIEPILLYRAIDIRHKTILN